MAVESEQKIELETRDGVDMKVNDSIPGSGFGVRHIITFILTSCLAVNFLLRVNLSVAVVVMTDTTRNDSYAVFDWSPEKKGMLLSSFFTGYLVSNLISGVIVTRYSNKAIIFWSVMYSTVISLLTPLLVTWGGYAVMFIIRVSMGLVQGCMMPVTLGLLSKWIPANERSRCASLVHSGVHLGTIFSFMSSGFLSASPWGWPSVFYCSAILTGVWCLFWLRYGADSPYTSHHISEAEKAYVIAAIPQSEKANPNIVIPWRKIAKNKAVYALTLTMIGQSWGFWILVTQIPSYFSHVLHLHLSQNGALAAMPYISLFLISIPVSFLSDYLVTKKILSINAARKSFNTVGQWGAALGLFCLAFTTSTAWAVTFYTISVTMITFTFVGYHINHLDIAPNYAGLIMGLTNGIANVAAISGPAFVGFVVKPMDNVQGWKLVFLVASGMIFLGNCIFIFFGTADIQNFNHCQDSKADSDSEKAEKEPLNT